MNIILIAFLLKKIMLLIQKIYFCQNKKDILEWEKEILTKNIVFLQDWNHYIFTNIYSNDHKNK